MIATGSCYQGTGCNKVYGAAPKIFLPLLCFVALLLTSTDISQMLKLCFCAFKDRVVDDLNPVLNFTRKEVESLLHFVEEEPEAEKILLESLAVYEPVISQACQLYPRLISKVLLQ